MRRVTVMVIALMCILTAACGRSGQGTAAMEKVDYTVVNKQDIPKELSDTIEARKESDFEISADIEGYTYIAKGYGKQPTGGYSIRVDRLESDGTNMNFGTTLIGPSAGEAVNKMATYPYIVIKTKATEDNILFD